VGRGALSEQVDWEKRAPLRAPHDAAEPALPGQLPGGRRVRVTRRQLVAGRSAGGDAWRRFNVPVMQAEVRETRNSTQ